MEGQFATLEDFVAAACANEIGLGNPRLEQAKPIGLNVRQETPDLDSEQFNDLVAFVRTLPRPEQAASDDPAAQSLVSRGQTVFGAVGCAICHVPDLGGLKGVYSDFLLHKMADRGLENGYKKQIADDVPLPIDFPEADEWRTPPLWGVADSAPYFHDGASKTLETAITRHQGGAKPATLAYESLGPEDHEAILAFLKSLKAPKAALPAPGGGENAPPDLLLTNQ